MVQKDSVMYDSIIILGATATGKTGISIQLAKRLNTEIVNADSMYIYKDLSIGTAKPTAEEMDGVIHHLIGEVESTEDYNVSNYRTDAKRVIDDIISRGLVPIIVGGTGFYINSLTSDFTYGECTHNDDLRKELLDELNTYGKEHLYNHLMSIDPIIASTLHINDTSRIIRAIEIKTLSGKSKNDIVNDFPKILKNPLIIGLNMPRDLLYDKINRRVDIMIKDGLIKEVQDLVDRGLTPDNSQSMKGIGYKEIYDYLIGTLTLDEAIEKIKQHTRNYAKRQITWFKRYENIHWFDSHNDKQIVDKIIQLYNDSL